MAQGLSKFGKIFFLFLLIITLLTSTAPFYFRRSGKLTAQQAGEKAVAYIKDNMKLEASLVSAGEESGMYKIRIKIKDQEFDSYVTKDGRLLFPNAIDLEQKISQPTPQPTKKLSCADIKKSEQPLLEAFVVSKCPFGLQMIRVLNEIVKKIPSLKQYIKVEYLGSIKDGKVTSMHGDEEAQENKRQVCLREEQPEKFWSYLDCHIKKGKVDECLKGVDTNRLKNCLDKRAADYLKDDFANQDKYQISGSPTLVLNGVKIDEKGFSQGENLTMRSARMVEKLLCCGFQKEPSSCSQQLTSQEAATSFSESYSPSESAGSGSCQ